MPPRAEINVTPMIDVMLVLLLIYMIVTPRLTSPVVLPKDEHAASRPEEPGDITLVIDRDGAYSLAITGGGDAGPVDPGAPRPVSAERLGPQLAALYAGRTRDRILYLKIDHQLRFGAVEAALETAQRSGVRVVAAVTERRRPAPPP